MKRGPLRRTLSLRISASKASNRDAYGAAPGKSSVPTVQNGSPHKSGWEHDRGPAQETAERAGRRGIHITALDGGWQAEMEDADMPPQLPKLGETFAGRRAWTRTAASSRMLAPSRATFQASMSRSQHGPVSQSERQRVEEQTGPGAGVGVANGTSARLANDVHAAAPSPNGNAHDGPVQFQRMPKPPGWQEEQTGEIRRDWIAYLAEGMGISTSDDEDVDLETLVVRRMLEQAEEELFADSFDEWDTDDDEEDARLYTEDQKSKRRRQPGKRRSRSASRSRHHNANTPKDGGGVNGGPEASGAGERDGEAADSSLTGQQTGESAASMLRARGGGLLRRSFRRSQTTGDMDAAGDPRRRAGSTKRDPPSHGERLGGRRDENGDRRGGGVLLRTLVREESGESRASSKKSGRSGLSGILNGKGGGVLKQHRRKRSGGSTFSVSSRGSSRSRGSGRSTIEHIDTWRDKLAPAGEDVISQGGVSGNGCGDSSSSGGGGVRAGSPRKRAEIYRRLGKDGKVHDENAKGGRRRSVGRQGPANSDEVDAQVEAPLVSGDEGGTSGSDGSALTFTLTELLRTDSDKTRALQAQGRRDGVGLSSSERQERDHTRSRDKVAQGVQGTSRRAGGGGSGGVSASGSERSNSRDSRTSASSRASASSRPTAGVRAPATANRTATGAPDQVAARAARGGSPAGAENAEGIIGLGNRNMSAAIAAAIDAAGTGSSSGHASSSTPGSTTAASEATAALEAVARRVGRRRRPDTSTKDRKANTISDEKRAEAGAQRRVEAQPMARSPDAAPSSKPHQPIPFPVVMRDSDGVPAPKAKISARANTRGGAGMLHKESPGRSVCSADSRLSRERDYSEGLTAVDVERHAKRTSAEERRLRLLEATRAVAASESPLEKKRADSAASASNTAARADLGRSRPAAASLSRGADRLTSSRGSGAGASNSSWVRKKAQGRRATSGLGASLTFGGDNDDGKDDNDDDNDGEDDNKMDNEALARAAAVVVANAVATGAAARAPEGTVDDPINAAYLASDAGRAESLESLKRGRRLSSEQGLDLKGDRTQLRSKRHSEREARAAMFSPYMDRDGRDRSSVNGPDAGAGASATHRSRSSLDQPPGARFRSAAGSGGAVEATSNAVPPNQQNRDSPASRDSSQRRRSVREGDTGRRRGGEHAQQRRGRSRERRTTFAGAAGEASGESRAATGPRAGTAEGMRARSVVQSIGAAGAAAAAADDGGYGEDWDKLEMHRAVYASDVRQLRLFIRIRPQGLKQADHHGNTPLLLALKLGRTEMAWIMVRAGADLDVPSDGSFHLLDEAIVLGDEDLLVEVYGRLQRQSWGRWRSKVPDLLALLADSIPDFYMEMHWSFECSNVLAPIVKAVAPHDHYRIWKRGSWLRMDSTITGYTKRFKTQRGNVSLLFLGNDSPGPGTLIKLDHGKKKIYNVLRRLESPTPSEVRRTCKRYLTSGQSKRPAHQVDAFVIKSSELDFKEVRDPSGKLKTATVGPWACERYECTGDMQLQTFRKGPGDNLLTGLSMKDYFDASQTLTEKVLKASGGTGAAGGASPSPGTFFNFGDRSRENQKAKILAKMNTPHKRYEKKMKASMWMCQDFPLTLEHVTPMLEVLSMQDKVIHKLKEVLTTKGMREAGFPTKVSLPLYLGVCAAVTFDNCKIFERGELEPELFLVNPEYSSSRRMHKGVFEGAMPGNIILRPESMAIAAEGNPPCPMLSANTTASTTPHRVTPGSRGSVGRQPPFKVWQPSFGPGSPQTPVAAFARAAKVQSSTSFSALGKAATGNAARQAIGGALARETSAGAIGGGRRIQSATDPSSISSSRSFAGWQDRNGVGLLGRGRDHTRLGSAEAKPGEWEGGDSDEDDDDEDDDDLLLHR